MKGDRAFEHVGVFHITLDSEGTIVHRSFVPATDWERYSNRWGLPKIDDI